MPMNKFMYRGYTIKTLDPSVHGRKGYRISHTGESFTRKRDMQKRVHNLPRREEG